MSEALLSRVRQVSIGRDNVTKTLSILQQFGTHEVEGLVLWLGRLLPELARVEYVFLPDQSSLSSEDGLGYFVTGETLFQLNRDLAATGLRLIAQVHSHPNEAYHSHADDKYAIVTAEGGFSLVVPNFGDAEEHPGNWAVYRLSQGRWTEVDEKTAMDLFVVTEAL